MGGGESPPPASPSLPHFDNPVPISQSLSVSDIAQYDGNISIQSNESENQRADRGNPIPVHISQTRLDKVFIDGGRIPIRKVIKRNNSLLHALNLPSVMSINPRSLYNKADEFLNLVEQYESQVIFLSETWDRVTQPLENLINLENYRVITSPNPRNFRGGKPALVINEEKFHIKPLNPEPITVPDGVEAVWALITPKNSKQTNQFNHIAVAAIYYRGPKSTKKEELFDHIAKTYHFLMAKYGTGLQFIIAGDTNR